MRIKLLSLCLVLFFSFSNFGITAFAGLLNNAALNISGIEFTEYSLNAGISVFQNVKFESTDSCLDELTVISESAGESWDKIFASTCYNTIAKLAIRGSAFVNFNLHPQNRKQVPLFILYHSWKSFLS